jgi:hypothetical protein
MNAIKKILSWLWMNLWTIFLVAGVLYVIIDKADKFSLLMLLDGLAFCVCFGIPMTFLFLLAISQEGQLP